MSQILGSEEKIAGFLLVASIIPFAGLAILAIRGDFPSLYGLFRPIEDLADRLPLNAWGLICQVANLVLVVAGFGMLAVQLQGAGDRALPLIAFALLVGSAILMALEGSFYQSMNPWAAKEAVRTGSSPELYQAMHHWFNTSVQLVYMILGLLAFAGFGWSVLRTGLLPAWAGWMTVLWSLSWLILTVVTQITIPAGVFLWPWILGAILILEG